MVFTIETLKSKYFSSWALILFPLLPSPSLYMSFSKETSHFAIINSADGGLSLAESLFPIKNLPLNNSLPAPNRIQASLELAGFLQFTHFNTLLLLFLLELRDFLESIFPNFVPVLRIASGLICLFQ